MEMKTRYEQMWEAVEREHGNLFMREAFVTLTALEWADKTMIERACEWLYRNWREYIYQDGDGGIHFGHWESDFRKAMEEE
jgi:hypothetical protein